MRPFNQKMRMKISRFIVIFSAPLKQKSRAIFDPDHSTCPRSLKVEKLIELLKDLQSRKCVVHTPEIYKENATTTQVRERKLCDRKR